MLLFVVISWIGWASGSTSIKPLGITDIFPAIWSGFKQRAAIILFVFAIGGLLCVLDRSKILDAGIESLTKKMNGKEIFLIPLLMILFGLGGTTYGMWEETLAFFPVIIPIFIKAKYGPLTGIFVILLGAGTGCLASTINPFSVGLAFSSAAAAGSIANQGAHMGLRWLIWVIFMIPAILFVMWYAKRNHRTDVSKSYLSKENRDKIRKKFFRSGNVSIPFTTKRKISLYIFLSGFAIMIFAYLPWGSFLGDSAVKSVNIWLMKYLPWFATSRSDGNAQTWAKFGNWYFISVAGLFLINTIIIFLINIKDYKTPSKEEIHEKHIKGTDQRFIDTYFEGVKWMIPVCLLIAFASGLGVILALSGIGPWIANSISGLGNIGLVGFGLVIFLLCFFLSILVPSTSGFSAAFIPIFAKLAMVAFSAKHNNGVNLQIPAVNIVILGFLLSNGLANFFTPTSAPLMAYTAYAGIEYKTWLKGTWKFILFLFALSILVMILSALLLPIISF